MSVFKNEKKNPVPKLTKEQLVALVRESGINPDADMSDLLNYDIALQPGDQIRIRFYEPGLYLHTSTLTKQMLIKESDIPSADVRQTFRAIVAHLKLLKNNKDFESHYPVYLAYYYAGGPVPLYKMLYERYHSVRGPAPAPFLQMNSLKRRRPSFSSVLGNSPNSPKSNNGQKTKKASKKVSKVATKTRGRPAKKHVATTIAAPTPAPYNNGTTRLISGFRIPHINLPILSNNDSNSSGHSLTLGRIKKRMRTGNYTFKSKSKSPNQSKSK